MNTRDRGNLDFLLNAEPGVLASWYSSASLDDIKYATELLHAYQIELDESLTEQQVRCSEFDPRGAYLEANEVLSKYRVVNF